MTAAEAVAIATELLQTIASLVKGESMTAADLLARIKADEIELAGGLAADDAAAQAELDKKFPR